MIATFLKLKQCYEKWWQKYPKEFAKEERLTNQDWEQLEKIDFFMTALDNATKFLEGPRVTLERMIPTMEFILDHFEQGKVCSNQSITTYNYTLLLNRALALFLFL